jgi:hypothetical protein
MKFSKLIIAIVISLNAFSLESVWSDLTKTKNRISNYPRIIGKLVDAGMYHTAVPYVKEYLVRAKKVKGGQFDKLLEQVISQVGDRQFVLLPEKYLSKSNSPTLRYILAKKMLRKRRYEQALAFLNGSIEVEHPVKPFALMLEGTIFAIQKKSTLAVNAFQRCVKESSDQLSDAKTKQKRRQLLINKDYCLAGIARSYYNDKKYEEAESAYLDIDKKSYVWPELLVEEAWNSYYQGNYNRALGKLVTYKAPIMDKIFNPEIRVLNALSYLGLCLYDDAIKVIDDYYGEYERDFGNLNTLINSKKNLRYFFLLANSFKDGKKYGSKLVNTLLENIISDPAFLNSLESYERGKEEAEKIKGISNRRLRAVFARNLKDSLSTMQKIMGSYVKRSLRISAGQIQKGFAGMSYIKLEVLSKRKASIYAGNSLEGKRGDIKYLKRNEKQYFWLFNGEFWADELGDYVFALRSECN